MHRLSTQTLIVISSIGTIAVGACTGGVPDDAVATFDGGWVTAAEARRFLARFDTRRLRTEASLDDRDAVTQILGELAFRKIVAEQAGAEPPSLTPLYLDDRASLLVNYYVERKGKRSYEVTDEEALAFYNQHLADRFTTPESITFRHIFLRADRHAPEELARLERNILDRLAAGAPFSELVAQYSESDSSSRDGTVGPVYRGRMDPHFEEAVYRLTPDRPDVVHTAQGTHIVVVGERRPAEVETFEAVKRQIVNAIMDRRNQAEREQLLAGLRERYGVEDRSAETDAEPDEPVIRVKDRSMTRQQLDSYLGYWVSLPDRVHTDASDVRRQAADELITANLLYLDAVDSGLDQEPEFLDRWEIRSLQRRSTRGTQRMLASWAEDVGEDEVLSYYHDNEARFAVPQRFRASYVFMPFGGGPPFELQQRIEQLARVAGDPDADPNELERQCTEAGALFVDMGWITPRDAARVGPEFQRRLVAVTAPGSTAAFKDQAGIYAINVRAIEPRRAMVPPEDMELIRQRYVQLRRGEIVAELQQRVLEERHFKVLATDVFADADAR